MAERAPPRLCTAPECGRPHFAKGLCQRHYQAQYRKHGPKCKRRGCRTPSFAKGLCVRHYQAAYRAALHRPCARRGCTKRAFSRGLCLMHYHRWYRKARGAALDAPLQT